MNKKKTVLIVDDEEDVLVYLSTLFEDNGFETRIAENGVIALEIARSKKIDLITLDVTMPEQSGIKTYCHLKTEQTLKDIPVIFITAVGEPIENVMSKLSVFPKPESLMSKPIDRKALISVANEILA